MSSPSTSPSVSISATLDYNGNPIIINSGDLAQLKKGVINFSLSQPVSVGSIDDFLTWLHTKWNLPDLSAEVNSIGPTIQPLPVIGNLYSAFESFMAGQITIEQLSINTTDPNNKQYQLAVTLALDPPVNLFGPINFDSIGVSVMKTGA